MNLSTPAKDPIAVRLKDRSAAGRDEPLRIMKCLIDSDATAIKLGDCFYQAKTGRWTSGYVLVSIEEAVKKLAHARNIVDTGNMDLRVFSCTDAKMAVAVHAPSAPEDLKYLCGTMTSCDLRSYCGGLDAAIARSLVYAQYADVVCFKSPTFDPSAAWSFEQAIRASFPLKRLGFCYSPIESGRRMNEADHVDIERRL